MSQVRGPTVLPYGESHRILRTAGSSRFVLPGVVRERDRCEMDILLLGAVTCLVIITIGYLINKYLQMPWMFTVVVFGMVLSSLGWFKGTMGSPSFQFLAKAGMLFFLQDGLLALAMPYRHTRIGEPAWLGHYSWRDISWGP